MIKFFTVLAFAAFLVWALLSAVDLAIRHDSTDPPGGRSGLRLLTDYETGCQYYGSVFGSLTPLLDASGRHICKR